MLLLGMDRKEMAVNDTQRRYMDAQIRRVAQTWRVTVKTAARILAGREFSDFWKNVSADEYLNVIQAMPPKYEICRGCDGQGRVYSSWEDGDGRTCKDCDGRGHK